MVYTANWGILWYRSHLFSGNQETHSIEETPGHACQTPDRTQDIVTEIYRLMDSHAFPVRHAALQAIGCQRFDGRCQQIPWRGKLTAIFSALKVDFVFGKGNSLSKLISHVWDINSLDNLGCFLVG